MNMEISIKRHSEYINAQVAIEHATFDLGFHNMQAATDLAEHLKEVASDIEHQIELINRDR